MASDGLDTLARDTKNICTIISTLCRDIFERSFLSVVDTQISSHGVINFYRSTELKKIYKIFVRSKYYLQRSDCDGIMESQWINSRNNDGKYICST